MEKALKEFFDSLLVQRKKCPWAKSRSIEQQLPELESEIQELKQAIAKNDLENMREEYGDMLWDALFIGIIAEEKGLFSIKDAIQKAHAKLKRRKPWVFGNEKVKTQEEAVKRWNEIKAKEKKRKSRRLVPAYCNQQLLFFPVDFFFKQLVQPGCQSKHILMTYVISICSEHMHNVYPRYRGLPIIPSKSALNELMQCNMLLEDVVRVLREGFDCSQSKRKKGTQEKCVRKGKKTLKVVVAKSFNYSLDIECWVLTHVGMF